MNEEQNTEALKKARTFSDNKDKIDGFYNGYVQATIDLEKENAELKDYRLKTMAKEQTEMSKYAVNLENKLGWYDTQLTKAKEILKEFVHHYKAKTIYVENMQDLLEEAEQFLNSEVEK